jgi:hypothetical protein
MKIRLKQDFERLAIHITPELYIGVFYRGKDYDIPQEIGNYLVSTFPDLLEIVEE